MREANVSSGRKLWVCALTAGAAAALLTSVWAVEAGEPARRVAKVAAVQNIVESRRAAGEVWARTAVDEALFARDRVRTGPASRAAILYSDQTLHRLGEKSEIEVEPPTPASGGVLRVLSGTHYFSSRTPKDYGRIETPTVTAAIKGTEFVVEVAADRSTTITMLEGTVEASNENGRITVGRGEAAYAAPGQAPVKRIVVRPADAVAWCLYYPPVLGGADAERLRSLGAEGDSLARVAELLAAGKVDEAKPLLDSVRRTRENDPIALALASTIATAEGHKSEATTLADSAVAADPRSAAAALAASFAAQASFDIRRARSLAEKAADLDPSSPVALSRAAELRMAEGDLDGALRAANASLERKPDDARALAVLGFVELARYRSREAETVFERAVTADSALGLAQLGLGIARIRRGKVDRGREALQTAVALDPQDSLARSYLGKAYYEERRSREASKEFAAAKVADPLDPTPWLYDAITKQNENRPAEALRDLQEAEERNDRRAVYRSRLLLDQDAAVRSSDLARIYNDLGFDQLGTVAARRSADQDQANFSSHSLLAGSYRYLPRYAAAYLSEILQARMYQLVGVNAVRPDAVAESVSFNEYTALFDRPRYRAFGDLAYGETSTDLSGVIPPGELCTRPDGSQVPCIDLVQLDHSRLGRGNVIGTYNSDRVAAALQVQRAFDQGFRQNSDQSANAYRGFVQYAPTWRDSLQLHLQYGTQDFGDLPIRQIPYLVTEERFDATLKNAAFGYHRKVTPANDLAVSAIYNETQQTGTDLLAGVSGTATLKGPQLEAQDVWRLARMTFVFGAGGFDGKQKLETAVDSIEADDRYVNGYAYGKFRVARPVEITAGAAFERVDAPVGLLPPRDSNIPATDLPYSYSQWSPKVGISAYLKSRTTLRAAWYRKLAPAIGRIQSLEPTQVAGFNQFFDDPGGTRSASWGIGFDQEIVKGGFIGASYGRRDRTIPQAYCETPDQFSGCAFQEASIVSERTSDDEFVTAYLNATIGKRVALSLDWNVDRSQFDYTRISPVGYFQDFIRTARLRPQVRFFLPFGLYGVGMATLYDQRVDQFDDLTSDARYVQRSEFWVVDAQLGWRLPRRYGSVVLEGRNLSNRQFLFYDRAVQETVIPARSVDLRVILTY
jgi:tetratricopeptide (TPR) repeat protein